MVSQKNEDVMAIVREYGNLHLWITNTMNIKCKEVNDQLNMSETPYDRTDIIIRVFRIKHDSMMDDIIKNEIFGKVTAYLSVIEFQNRGASHSHSIFLGGRF